MPAMTSKILLTDKVAIITGASAGIGEATAVLFAARGAKLVIHGRRPEKLQEVSIKCQNASSGGHKPIIVAGNIEDENVRAKLIKEAVTSFGKLDIVVNNAGYVEAKEFDKLDANDLRKMLECHVVAPYDLSLKALPYLEKTSGCILNNTSVAADRALKGRLTYSTAKAALEHMTRCLAIEVGARGVRVNAVAPGIIVTEVLRGQGGQQLMEMAGKKIHPLKQVGYPDDIAEAFAFLACDASRLTTAAVLAVDGGYRAASTDLTES